MDFFTFSFKLLLERFVQLVKAPIINPDMLWIALPLLLTLVIIELYFGRYRDEKLGWNTALTNTLVLIFVSLNLFQQVFRSEGGSFFRATFTTGFYIALFIFVLGIVLFLVDFFHTLPRGLAFTISAHLPVNLTAYTAIVLVYNKIPLDFATILAWIAMIIILGIIFFFIKLLEPRGVR